MMLPPKLAVFADLKRSLISIVQGLTSFNQAVYNSAYPIGAPIPWLISAVPTYHILLDGSVVSIEQYKELFRVYGAAFGACTDATFTLPNLSGRYLFGLDSSGTGSALATPFGAKDMVVSIAAHVHTSAAHSHNTAAHYHGKGTIAIGDSGLHSHSLSSGVPRYDAVSGTYSIVNAGANQYSDAPTQTGNATHQHGNANFTGSVGNTGGVDGDSSQATSSTTPSDTGSAGSYTSSTMNPPSYPCLWITRYQ